MYAIYLFIYFNLVRPQGITRQKRNTKKNSPPCARSPGVCLPHLRLDVPLQEDRRAPVVGADLHTQSTGTVAL